MKKRLYKLLRILVSGFCGVCVFALFLWQGFWIALGWIMAALISAFIALFVYSRLE